MYINSVLQSINQGVLICDRSGRIAYFNQYYSELLGHTLEEVKGQKITSLRPHALTPQVAKTGEPVEGTIREENGTQYYASIYPIIENERIAGTISIVTSIDSENTKHISKHQTLAERVHDFEKKEIELAVKAHGGGTEGKRKAAQELGISLATLYNKLNM